jgi:flagellar biogenesis protein FliO
MEQASGVRLQASGEAGTSAAPTSTPTPTATSTAAPAVPTFAAAGPSLSSLALPGLALLALAIAALVLGRRRRALPRRVRVLETTSLGPRRALVLARLGDELLLLGSSEAGVTLLRSQPAADLAEPAPAAEPAPEAAALPGVADLAARLASLRRKAPGPAAPAAAPPGFDALLAETAEDQELRRKLARGQAGSVR